VGILEREALAAHLESYKEGYEDGYRAGKREHEVREFVGGRPELAPGGRGNPHPKKRKLSAWNKFVKANSKKPRFIYRNGKLNLKKMAVAFRKTPAGKKKRKR
jgi:hypothetical protein